MLQGDGDAQLTVDSSQVTVPRRQTALAFDSKGRLLSVQTTPGQTKIGVLYPKGSEACVRGDLIGRPGVQPK